MSGALDPITERVLGSAFGSICAEMGHTMLRTANSSVFVEGRDFSCALVDAEAGLVATANFDPSHLSAMALTVEYVMLHFGRAAILPGDVFLVNDPYRGGGHLPDITLIRPLFHSGRLLAFAVNRAHHVDIGGMAVAGFPGTAKSTYQEGLRIPPVKWFAAGEERRDILELITLNVRFPRDQIGDLRAQEASTRVAERRFAGLVAKYGVDTVAACMAAVQDHSEQLMRAVIAGLPDGTWRFTEFMEDDGHDDRPYRIEVALKVAGDAVTVDFTGSSAQALGPINSSYGNTLSSTYNALMQLVGPEVAFNSGCFRPIEVVAPRGSLLNPVPPAPCFGGVTETSIRIIDAVLGALAPAAPDRLGAGTYGTCINFSGGGYDRARQQDFGFYLFCEGGWGATAWRDGWNCTPNPTSNFNDYPVEWVEATMPLRYLEARLNPDSGGPGRFRGGVGSIRSFELLEDEVELNGLGERMVIPPFGLEGGRPGGLNRLEFRRHGGREWQDLTSAFGSASPSKFYGHKAARGDRFRIVTGGGGGFGPPLERDPARVVEDVREGFVTPGAAAGLYGVVLIAGADGQPGFDPQATAVLRRRLAGARDAGDYEALISAALKRAAGSEPDVRTRAEIAAVAEIVAARAENTPGRSLDTPFDNRRALAFWDSWALRRWLSVRGRHD
ncbi:hydantoinase B/oxoprolinase family protein [Zavarzinia sp.]|uniref:hydantoinase B/oxoprolinase family protein n=1 Tax=Zavarzinia sp. TaxID=2027920 RepID=UPI00356724F1